MKNASLLVLVGSSLVPSDLESLSETARDRGLHLSVVVLGATPQIPTYAYGVGDFGSFAIPLRWQEQVDQVNAELNECGRNIETYLAEQGCGADVSVLVTEPGTMPEAISRRALTCDLVAVSGDLRADNQLFHDVVRGALFHSPSGVLLNGLPVQTSLQPERAFVAWKAGLPAARAVRQAMPILRHAKEVTVAMFDPNMASFRDGENPGSDVALWLTRQGCNVQLQQYPSGGEEIGKAVMKRAKECQAQLIVMGAYDHSRLREIVFGGTTQTLIAQTDSPVLLSH